MRYSASDKTEIIRLVEQSHLPARRTLDKLGVPRSSFYRWYDRHQRGGPEALAEALSHHCVPKVGRIAIFPQQALDVPPDVSAGACPMHPVD